MSNDNVIEFRKQEDTSQEMFQLHLYKTKKDEFEVYLEINDNFTNEEIFEGMLAVSMKFAEEHGITDENDDNRADSILQPAND